MERTNVGYCLPAVQSIFIYILLYVFLNKILHKLKLGYKIIKYCTFSLTILYCLFKENDNVPELENSKS